MKPSHRRISITVTAFRMVMKNEIEYITSGMIVCHNHPSGNINPSGSDSRITQKIKEADNLLDNQLLDHLIISDKDYYNFEDNELI
jgi:DNA repair protein RadC